MRSNPDTGVYKLVGHWAEDSNFLIPARGLKTATSEVAANLNKLQIAGFTYRPSTGGHLGSTGRKDRGQYQGGFLITDESLVSGFSSLGFCGPQTVLYLPWLIFFWPLDREALENQLERMAPAGSDYSGGGSRGNREGRRQTMQLKKKKKK